VKVVFAWKVAPRDAADSRNKKWFAPEVGLQPGFASELRPEAGGEAVTHVSQTPF
jgi:hypothetical protein